GLAGTSWANNGQAAACWDRKVDVLKHGHAVISKAKMAELNLAGKSLAVREISGHGSVGNFRFGNQNFIDPAHGSRSALEDVDDPAKSDDRPREQENVNIESDEIA